MIVRINSSRREYSDEIEVRLSESSWMIEELSLTSSGLASSYFSDERLREGQLVVDPEHFSETQVNTTTTRCII